MSIPITWSPLSNNLMHNAEPMKPELPVTNTFIFSLPRKTQNYTKIVLGLLGAVLLLRNILKGMKFMQSAFFSTSKDTKVYEKFLGWLHKMNLLIVALGGYRSLPIGLVSFRWLSYNLVFELGVLEQLFYSVDFQYYFVVAD